MPPPDTSQIAGALIAKLLGDATLMALVPDGVYFDEAAPGKTKFLIVSLKDAVDEAVFGGRAIEDALYLVKAVMLSTAGGNIAAAAARIDVLLEDQPLTAAGYVWRTMHREEPVRFTEVDAVDNSIRWQHRGGLYRVDMAVA